MAAYASATSISAEAIILGIVCILIGLLMTFAGYRLYKIVLFVAAFLLGYWVCYTIMVNANNDYGDNEDWILFGSSVGAGLLTAIVVMLLVSCLVPLGLFVLGALGGFFLAIWILSFIDPNSAIHEDEWRWLFICGMMLLVGVLAAVLRKPIIVTTTAISGAFVLFYGIDQFAETGFADLVENVLNHGRDIQPGPLSDAEIAMLSCCAATAVLGIIVQIVTTRRLKNQERSKRSAYEMIN
ncbi:hypothetical protein H696_00145 [Fonticula alba]|uniref:Transmembrane protein 198 n=1 Tax=Fonticula alba TaxID=691883 RepID=A0A058ZDW5_FONAL|nr:hypothetical protein H696_00145 [Fonticula alba]KCV72554.1 hypothetical protein H696_00145 [Fonticula alba]|eukprot:XP_009492255.1 hypothetical protein H696_00145 [Fonticula alba]